MEGHWPSINHININYSTGMAIKPFEKLYRKYGFTKLLQELYIFRPIYKKRFGLPSVKSPNIPGLREIITFGCEALLRKQ